MPSSLNLFDPDRHALPLPESFAALEAMRELLHARADGKNLRFVEFALRFESLFKDASTARPTPLQQADACRRAAWQFDLPTVEEMRAYQAAVEIAGALGLVAYDAALGIGFLPNGQVVPTEFAQATTPAQPTGKLPWGARPPDALRGESEVREVLAPALARAMAGSGFELEAAPPDQPGASIVLARRIGAVRQALTVNLMRYEALHLTLCVWHDACTAVLAQALGPRSHQDTTFELSMEFFEPGPDAQHRWKLERLAQLPAVLTLVCGRVLPLAGLCSDLHGLDQLLNDASADTVRTPYRNAYNWSDRPAGSDGSRSLRDEVFPLAQRLVIAHLNGNPFATDIDSELESHWQHSSYWRAPQEREALAAVRAALAHTPPLARWSDVAAWRAALRPIPASLQSRTHDPRGRRCHNFEVTAALHQDLYNNPGAFWARFASPHGAAELSRIWQDRANTLPASERIPPDGLKCHAVTLPGKADEGAIEVVCLCFPPITGLDEHRILALARRGDIWRTYRMGYDHALDDDGQMQLRIEYQARQGNADVIARETLDAELSVQEFLERVAQLFK
ncbi:hypothetical protein [Acidovorax sp. 1608163]|uniref:hypothetical protein n=1 Tax=Acidovorax sp. 1608163 TaxID=2478662 RepID=UPI0013CE5ABB|nr:hypothetical protein [Acidovorax sp. 1608163]